jgi:sigma-B regulation protein RsbQ
MLAGAEPCVASRRPGDHRPSDTLEGMDVLARNNVTVHGRADGMPMLFAHGFGCDQHMWRHVAPRVEDDFQVVLFDHVGAGGSDLSAYDPDRYSCLAG